MTGRILGEWAASTGIFRIFAAGIWILSGISVKDYLLYIAALKGIRPIVAKKKVNKLLAQVGLSKAVIKKRGNYPEA